MTRSRPILMSTPMVKALLEGRKVQTRRIIKPQPEFDEGWWKLAGAAWSERVSCIPCVPGHSLYNACPYGKPGDLLWCKESFKDMMCEPYQAIYRADGERPPGFNEGWRSAVYMPRIASRLTLELTEVRVERLNSISEEDAIAEGVFFTDYGRKCFHRAAPPQDVGDCPAPPEHHPQRNGWMWDRTTSPDQCLGSAISAYGNLWNSINGLDSWSENPWCWVLAFKVHKQNVDAMLKEAA